MNTQTDIPSLASQTFIREKFCDAKKRVDVVYLSNLNTPEHNNKNITFKIL